MDSQIKKVNIFLAGDSTMQSYSDEKRPQYGWGELLYKYIDIDLKNSYHRKNSPFEQQKCFETQKFIIDNCAMAGRSLKSFINEERHTDIFENINAGDYLIMQFGHNDIAKEKPERYIPIEKLAEFYDIFIKEAIKKSIKLIILSPILIDIYTNDDITLKNMVFDLKKYIVQIEKIAKGNKIPFINVGDIAQKEVKYNFDNFDKLYLADHVHLNVLGADFYAKIITEKLIGIIV